MKTKENIPLRIIIIGNYKKDKQMSMELFANLLKNGFESLGHASDIWTPTICLGHLTKNSLTGIGKWLAYVDKWLLFPLVLSLRLLKPGNRGKQVRFLIADHSNVIYLKYLPKDMTIVSCHDVLAIRGAMGFKDAYCEASKFGKVLQNWILKGLLNANKLAAVSSTTLDQLNALDTSNNKHQKDRRLILNAFNEAFEPIPRFDAFQKLSKYGLHQDVPFMLHIGSDLPRKNRKMLVEMLYLLKDSWNGIIVFAGKALDSELLELIRNRSLADRVVSITHPSYTVLNALYSACEVFVFPSFSEGFGWPIIEAQVCGAPVIASNIEPIPEVSGGAAVLCKPNNPDEFAEAFKFVSIEKNKSELVQKGFVNCNRFKPQRMIEEYISFFLEDTNEKTT